MFKKLQIFFTLIKRGKYLKNAADFYIITMNNADKHADLHI